MNIIETKPSNTTQTSQTVDLPICVYCLRNRRIMTTVAIELRECGLDDDSTEDGLDCSHKCDVAVESNPVLIDLTIDSDNKEGDTPVEIIEVVSDDSDSCTSLVSMNDEYESESVDKDKDN